MKNKKIRQNHKTNKIKLIDPVMRFDIGILGYSVDIKKTKKILKWLRKKKK